MILIHIFGIINDDRGLYYPIYWGLFDYRTPIGESSSPSCARCKVLRHLLGRSDCLVFVAIAS